jgi:pyruvate kinase
VRHTKIIATVGPATSSEETIHDLVRAGVDIVRLNFSHGTHQSHGEIIARVRAAAAKSGRTVAVLQDLSGPKIRTGPLAASDPLRLEAGDQLTISVGDAPGVPGRVFTTYAGLPEAVRPGDMLLLDDGRIQVRVQATTGNEIRTTIVHGGMLGAHKGINAPGVVLPTAGLSEKDAEDLAFGVSAGVDFIALSFVQSAADLQRARDAIRAAGASHIPLVAKLERPEAVACLDEILRASDAVMVARGDLGLELPLEIVPRVQKQATRRARTLGIPVIVATQVLESMRSEPRPTRAEVSDAANAVDDRVDAIMLAGETAVGLYPVRAVETLDAIIRDAESVPPVGTVPPDELDLLPVHGRAMCEAAVTLASHAGAAAIVAITRGGKTARVLSALRPPVPVFAATDQTNVAQRLVLSWGVVPWLTELQGGIGAAADRIGRELVEHRSIPANAPVVLVSVTPDLRPGPSNFLKLQRA